MTDSSDQHTIQANSQSGWLHRFIQTSRRSDIPFFSCFILLGAAYVALIVAMLSSDVAFTSLKEFFPTLFSDGWWGVFSLAAWAEAFKVASKDFLDAFASEEIRYSFYLSLISCTISAVLSVIVAVPIGYLMSRWDPSKLTHARTSRKRRYLANFSHFSKNFIDAALDIPIVLPPLVIGVSLLIFFQTRVGKTFETLFQQHVGTFSVVVAGLIVLPSVLWMTAVFLQGRSRPISFSAVGAIVLLWLGIGFSRLPWLYHYSQEYWGGMATLNVVVASVALSALVYLAVRFLPVDSKSIVISTVWAFYYGLVGVGCGILLARLYHHANNHWAVGVTYNIPAVILAQFTVACAFAVRTMRVTFDQIDTRREQVALTLGCNRGQAFFGVVLPEAVPGAVTAGTLAWARSMGEFGPILIFAGTTRMKTEVLPSTVFLEFNTGNIEMVVVVSLIMVTVSVLVLILARLFGIRKGVI
jgi:ABC-type sulfate transport system permease component